MMRPTYGNAFRLDRVLNVFFYTSNADKLLQARLVFARYGYSLRHYKGRTEPYDEDESLGTERLLSRAIRQVASEFGVRSVFFVEDTSLRIEALSDSTDYPGLSVKRWFLDTSFDELNRQISLRGGNRRAVVKSDIALHIPTLGRPIFFHGETAGTIPLDAPTFAASTQYPWLTPDTFNGWFVPDGANRRLGEMEFEMSLGFDFRARALCTMISRLEELNSVLNLPSSFYIVRRPEVRLNAQLWLPGAEPLVLVIIGLKCAGKTTLSDHLVSREGIHTFEASTVLRDMAVEQGIEIQNSHDASQFLIKCGFDCVARRIGDYMERVGPSIRVISGLRTVEEILHIRKRFAEARVLLVDSDHRVRFERHIRRARDQEVKTMKDFLVQDEEQRAFGAMRVANEIADISIRNDGDLRRYLQRVDEIIASGEYGSYSRPKSGELHRCLRALAALGRVATCDEIAKKTAELGAPILRYNTNRALKEVPEFAERINKRGRPVSYRLTKRGCSLLELLDISVSE